MPVVIASQSHADSGAAASSVTVAKPSGTADADLLIATLYAAGQSTVTSPGWTPLNTAGGGTWTLFKVAGSSEPANYTFTGSALGTLLVTVARITGAATANPITAHSARPNADGNTTAHVLPSITANAGDAIVQMLVTNLASTWTPPAGTTENYETAFGSGRVGIGGRDDALSSGGATGTRTWTSSASVNTSSAMFAVKPAPTSGPNVESWTTQFVAGGVIAVAKPTGTAAGDFLFVHCEGNTFPAVWTPPSSDWFQLVTASTGATFVKFATASEPASWTFTSDQAGSSISARATRVSNVGSFGMGDFASSRGTRTPTVFASKSAKPGALYLQDALLYPNPDIPTWTPPADTVEHEDAQYGFLGSTQITSGTETGSKTWTPTSPSSTQGAYSSAVLYGPTAAPVVRSWTAKNNDPATTSTAVPVPAGTVAGDLLIVSSYTANTNLTLTPPAGWTTIPKVGGNGGFWKIATGSEGATQTFSWASTLQNIYFQMVRVTGHSATNPIQASAFNPNNAAASDAVLPSMTVASANSTLLQLLVVDNSNTGVVWTNPATTQELWDTYRTEAGQPRNATYAGGVESVGPGGTGTRTWSINGTTGLGGLALVINPAVEVAYSPGKIIVTYKANNTFTVPAGVTSIKVQCVGGGAGGGNGSAAARGGGGGAGAYAYNDTLAVTPGETHAVVVGQSVAATTAGQLSSFGAGPLVRAAAGAAGATSTGLAGQGGAGGTTANSIPTTTTTNSGSTAGGSGVQAAGGTAPAPYGGAGGANNSTPAAAGGEAGGGGAGGALLGGAGGAGARGVVVVTFDYATEAVSAGDTRQLVVNFKRTFNETAAASDSLAKLVLKPFSDTVSASDAQTLRVVKSQADAVTAVDAIAKIVKARLSDTATATDARQITLVAIRNFSDTVTATDQIAKRFSMSKADAAAVTDLVAKTVRKLPADSVTVTDQMTKMSTYARTFGDSAVASDLLSKRVTLAFADTISGSSPPPTGTKKNIYYIFG